MPAAIGIDLGTTNSCCAVIEGGKAVVIPNQEGTRTTPSVIAVQSDSKFIVGHAAKRQLLVDPKGTVSAVKRLIGRSFFSETVQQARSVYPYAIVEGQGRDAYIQVGEDKFSPPELSSKVLGKLKEAAEQHLGEAVMKAVVTVPAYFDDRQRQATRDAGEIAGLDVIRIINEPTAAALAFGLSRQDAGTVAVFDLGGGTFDVSILEIKKGVFHVKSTCGDTFLGGEDFDQEIVKHFLAVCETKLQSRLPRDPFVLQRVREAAENAKHALSYEHEAMVSIPFLATGGGKSHSVQFRFTRAELERLVEPLVQRLAPFCEKAMEDAQLTPDRIEAVLLVGGMTRMPTVKRLAERVFRKSPRTDVNPDEAVALGAAIQAGILTGVLEKVLLLDVTPLSLGIETGGGIFTKVVDRNTTVPVKRSKVFTTAYDRQPMVEVHILQGERDMAQDNLSLGKFQLVGLPPAPRGVPQIDVLFEINADGILKVSAKDLGTGLEQVIRVEGYGGLTREQIDKLKAEAAEHQVEDLKRREVAEMRLNAEGILYSANRMLTEYGKAIEGNKGDDMRSLVHDLEAALTGDDLKKIQDVSHALTALVNACATGLYEAEAT